MNQFLSLKHKVDEYHEVLRNTEAYRAVWKDELKQFIVNELTQMIEATGLQAVIEKREKIGNLEAIICSMGKRASGIFERVDKDTNKPVIKHYGALIYQQLYNGKIQVLIIWPSLEGMPEPRPPKLIAIYRPEEMKRPFIERHMEEFVRALTEWEDFDDDDQPAKIGFHMPSLQLES